MAQSRGASIADVLGLTESKEASGYGVADGIVGKEGASLPARWALEERLKGKALPAEGPAWEGSKDRHSGDGAQANL